VAQKDNNSLYDGGHLHISDEVARLISPETGNEEKHRAIAGQLPLSIHDQIMLWYLFYIRSQDEQVKKLCLEGVERSSVMALKPILRSPDIDLHILEFILRGRRFDLPTLCGKNFFPPALTKFFRFSLIQNVRSVSMRGNCVLQPTTDRQLQRCAVL
jgi:hypothetical protein